MSYSAWHGGDYFTELLHCFFAHVHLAELGRLVIFVSEAGGDGVTPGVNSFLINGQPSDEPSQLQQKN